jgi:hypothetical protein
MQRVDAYGLQLLTGDLAPVSKTPRRPDIRRGHTVPPQRLLRFDHGHAHSGIEQRLAMPDLRIRAVLPRQRNY